MMDMLDPVVWPDDPDREQWWATVLGIDISEQSCTASDLVDQQRAVDMDDDGYPRTLHPAAA
ncbi:MULTISPECIES: hypothetical protein [Nocardiaceae]|uniref:hypothetical protein n=1 Tax=Nocardiaceae TaxID=85025 RepID=UPI000AF0553C|nr:MULTISPECIES: hypothetical protein [Rhodococcus]